MTYRQEEYESATVPTLANQAEEVRDRWSWAQPCVWTDRMLTSLEKGVKGGKWFSLIDKVYRKDNLAASFERVKRNRGAAGLDHVTLTMFESHYDDNIDKLSRQLCDGSYRPQAVRRVWIKKYGSKEKRPLGIPTVRDRVSQRKRGTRCPGTCTTLGRCRTWVVLYGRSLCVGLSVLSEVNHRLESRVRENRMHGSEGGGTGNTTGSSYPYTL